MVGVEILNQYEVVATTYFEWSTFWGILIILTVVAGLIGWLIGACQCETVAGILTGVIMGAILGTMSGAVAACDAPETYTTEYQVVISDDVSMVEFYEKYDVINQEGKIFSVREK